MSNPTEDEDAAAEAERERDWAALDAEFARVGVTWGALRAELARHAAAAQAARGGPDRGEGAGPSYALLFEFGPALAALQQMPDGAGVGPFVDWVRATRAWRAFWEREADA